MNPYKISVSVIKTWASEISNEPMSSKNNIVSIHNPTLRFHAKWLAMVVHSRTDLRLCSSPGLQCLYAMANKIRFSPVRSMLAVAEPPELSRLKCAGHHHKGNTGSNALQTEQFLICRVTSRYNHRFSDWTSIPRTKASPEILQPQFYNIGKIVITNLFKTLLQNQT